VNLSKPENSRIVSNSLLYWEKEKIRNLAFSVMPNHVHWVVEVYDKDGVGGLVYLQDLLHSVKRFSARKINQLEGRTGRLWQIESFDTTVRDEKHLDRAIRYTLNNPVKAGFCYHWKEWRGNWCCRDIVL
jgi:REP element-mobilizing transposase RayT